MKTDEPPIDLFLGFWPDPEGLFAELEASVPWDERMRARKTASFGVAYNYSQITYPEVPMHEALIPVCGAVSDLIGYTPNNCLLNFYRDGASSMGFHSDTAEELETDTGVAILSVGSARDIVYRSKARRDLEHRYTLEPGALLHMSDAVQESWLHAIPKSPGSGPRISITLRRLHK